MAWLDESEFVAVVGAAARAPSMLNSQPWRFRRRADTIDLLVDPDRRLPVVDSTGWAARIGCGAALFNLRLALAALGRPAVVTALPEYDDPYLLARLTPDRPRPPSPMEAQLYRAIPRRHSNRGPFADEPVPLPVRGKLSSAARAEEAWLDLLIGPVAVEATALMVRAADDVLCRDAAYQAETAAWVRRSTAVTDGIPVPAGGPAPRPHELLARRDYGGGELPAHRDYERDPLLAVLSVTGDWPADQVQAGQALQRVLLTATDLGLAASLFSQPIEVAAVRERLRRAVGRTAPPQMLMRLGYATATPRSPRRPVRELILQ